MNVKIFFFKLHNGVRLDFGKGDPSELYKNDSALI